MSRMFRFIRIAIGAAGAALVGFHAWLFAAQFAAGRLDDLWLIFRWISALVLIGALWIVRRGGDSIVGRKAVAIWILAAMLHAPAIADTVSANALALPETVAGSVLQIVASAALTLSLWLLAGVLAARRRQFRSIISFVPMFAGAGMRRAGVAWRFAPRPPPLHS